MDLEQASPFTMKDLMLAELLCQAGILNDPLQLQLIQIARKWRLTIGATLCGVGFLTAQELFSARRMVCRYLKTPEELEHILSVLQHKFPRNKKGVDIRREQSDKALPLENIA